MPVFKFLKAVGLGSVAAALLISGVCIGNPAESKDVKVSDLLKQYVLRPDEAFRFEVARTFDLITAAGYILNVTSQEWQGAEWQHWLFVVVPHNNRFPDKALLIVEGGRNREQAAS